MRVFAISFTVSLLLAGQVAAMGTIRQNRFSRVWSSNGEFKLEADPSKKTVTVFDENNGAQHWSFSYDVKHDEFMLSEDGETVVIMVWPRTLSGVPGQTIAMRFWNRQKGEIKTHRLDRLCDDFSGVGRLASRIPFFGGGVTTWFQLPATTDGTTLRVVTLDYYQCVFSLQTGELLDRRRVLSFSEMMLIGLGVVVAIAVIVVGLYFVKTKRAASSANLSKA